MNRNHREGTNVVIESLESRALFSASFVLTVTPRADATPPADQVAPQGCLNGISAHAEGASDGVVACQGGE